MKPKIGLLALMLKLYDSSHPALKVKQGRYVLEIGDSLSDIAGIVYPGVQNTIEGVKKAVHKFEQEKCCLIMVILPTYSPSLIATPALKNTDIPVVIFNTAKIDQIGNDFSPADYMENHGIHGVQDLSNTLLRAKKPFEILTGHYKDAETINELKDYVRAAAAVDFFKNTRIGIFGETFEGMGDFYFDEKAFSSKYGCKFTNIPLKEIKDETKDLHRDEITKEIEDDLRKFKADKNYNRPLHALSNKYYIGIKRILDKHKMAGFTMNFLSFGKSKTAETVPFLAAHKLLAAGYGYAGEGDLLCAALVSAMTRMTGDAGFTEMFCPDFKNNHILMSHMGEGNPNFARKDSPIQIKELQFNYGDVETPYTLFFSYEPQPVTLINLSPQPDNNYKIISTDANVVNFKRIEALETSNFKIAPSSPLPVFLTDYSKNGGTHHLAMVKNHVSGLIAKFAKIGGFEYVKI